MRRYQSVATTFTLSAALLGGCASKPKPVPMPLSPSASEVESIRTSYATAFPEARVGIVAAVTDGAAYALVSDIDTANIKEGAIVSFLDAEQTVIANGTVVKVDPGALTVKVDAGKRKAAVGDAAIKF